MNNVEQSWTEGVKKLSKRADTDEVSNISCETINVKDLKNQKLLRVH